ncbi:hypothetical protein SPONN_669 [uncultured Candidatus Thioglobus sp.]|nr:hypothetical protein SPONN_669 [uncultured Candidatus Thioglobus sp.]
MKTISIIKANYQNDYKISLDFNDGKTRTIDFATFIQKSHHPDIKKYQNLTLFKQFNINHGDLEWNDYDLAFPINDLYKNTL